MPEHDTPAEPTAGVERPAVAPLPSGAVTFLFSDIEGSTQLLREAGPDYPELLKQHQRLLRTAFGTHGGREVGTEGDSFFVAFGSAREAVAAAADGQRALADHPWPPGRAVSVRMGLHTGEATPVHGQYLTLAVHQAARIAAAASGGQVVLSDATAGLVRGALPQGTALRGLGAHRLKDFPRPSALHQLDVAGLRSDFPPLQTVRSPGSLPSPAGALVGRDRDSEAVAGLLRGGEVRLVTLTGPGGIGKTRLALESASRAADSFPGGVVFVPLAPVEDPGLVLGTVATTVGARREAGVSLVDSVSAALGPQRTLLVLDNLEQVVDAAADLATLLERTPSTVGLVTSRRLLRLRGEVQYPVAPLDLEAAARLFAQRAAAVRPGFALTAANAPAVTEICRRLDGLPLAVELAAARTRLLAPEALLARMAERLDVLGTGPVDLPARQRTLRATMDWSYGLLAPQEQRVLARLSVFAGGCTVDAAESVCGRPGEPDILDSLSELLAASLLTTDDSGPEPRLALLETVRTYAGEKLAASPDRAETEHRHTAWVLDLTVERLRTRGADHARWFDRFDRERPNVRAVARRALDAGDVATVARLTRDGFAALAHRDAEAEVVAWLDRALAVAGDAPSEVRGRLLVLRALGATVYGEFDAASALLVEGRQLLSEAGSAYDEAIAATTAAYIAISEAPGEAADRIDEASTRLTAVGDQLGRAYMEVTRGHLALHQGDLEAAQRRFGTGVRLAEELDDDAMRGRALSLLGLSVLARGDTRRARRSVVEGARANLRGGQPTSMAYSLEGLAAVALAEGRPVVAAQALAAATTIRRQLGHIASPAFAALLDDLVERTRAGLGVQAYATAGGEARGWPAEEALDRVLTALDELSGGAATAPRVGDLPRREDSTIPPWRS